MQKHPFTYLDRPTVTLMLGGFDWTALAEALKGFKVGQKGYLTAHKESQAKSKQQLGYYYAVILPEAVKAFLVNKDYSLNIKLGDKEIEVELTLDNMDNFLKLRYAAVTGKYVTKGDMDKEECSKFEDWAIGWLAQWLNCHVPPADPEWRKKVSE